MRGGIVAFALLLAASAPAQDRAIPFWPNAVPDAIHAEVDGVATLQTVRELCQFHRVQGSPGFAAAAELMKRKAISAGLADAAIERFPADGKTKYAHFLSHVGWDPVSGLLEEVAPTARIVASFPDLPVALADYSQDADVTAELVDVGAGTSAFRLRGPGRARARSSSPTGRFRPSTASPARSGERRGSSRRTRIRRRRGPATTAT